MACRRAEPLERRGRRLDLKAIQRRQPAFALLTGNHTTLWVRSRKEEGFRVRFSLSPLGRYRLDFGSSIGRDETA